MSFNIFNVISIFAIFYYINNARTDSRLTYFMRYLIKILTTVKWNSKKGNGCYKQYYEYVFTLHA